MAFQIQVKRTGGIVPPRILLHGGEGCGKSTFAAGAPSPVFIQTEDGLSAIAADSLGLAKTYEEMYAMMDFLITENHNYQTVVLDSADWAEPLIAQRVAEDHGLAAFDKNAQMLSYGRAAEAMGQKWGVIINKLDEIRAKRKMAVIVIAHTKTKKQKNPLSGTFDKLVPELESGGIAALVQWADIVGYAQKKIVVQEISDGFGNNSGRAKDTSGNMTFLYTMNHPAYSAKSRWNLPYEMPLQYPVFHSHLTAAMQASQPAAVAA